MMLLPCPECGPRNVSEFRYAGEVGARPDPATATAHEWRAYLFYRENLYGWRVESWYHRAGCRQYFLAERNTVTNEVKVDSEDESSHAEVVGEGAR